MANEEKKSMEAEANVLTTQLVGWKAKLRAESTERGWLFSVVAGWCVAMGMLCVVAAAFASLKWLWGEGASAEAVVRMVVCGLVILGATAWMWKLSPWGRNIAIVSVATVSWVLGEALNRKTGIGPEAQMLTVVFVAISLACFTSPHGIGLFRKKDDDEEEEGAGK